MDNGTSQTSLGGRGKFLGGYTYVKSRLSQWKKGLIPWPYFIWP